MGGSEHALHVADWLTTWIFTMAEIVNRILESVLPELEELERVGIFNEAEIR